MCVLSVSKAGAAGADVNPLLLGAFGFAALVAFGLAWTGPSVRRTAVLVGASALVGAYLAEAYVGFSEDHRTKASVVMDERRSGRPQTFGSIYPIDLVHRRGREDYHFDIKHEGEPLLPLAGIAHARTVQCREYGRDDFGWIIDDNDEHGFNNPIGIWQHRETQIVFIGDSFTHGECVPRELGLVAPVRREFQATINLGMPGNGPLMELATIVEYAVSLRPANVVWAFYRNDLLDLEEQRLNPLLLRYLDDGFSQDLLSRRLEIDRLLHRYHDRRLAKALAEPVPGRENAWTGRLLDIALLRNLRIRLDIPVTTGGMDHEVAGNPTWSLFRRIVRRAARMAADWGGQFYFVYLPAYREVVQRDPKSLDLRRRVLASVSDLNVPIIDLMDTFLVHASPKTLWQCERCHYSAAGYALAGQAIARALEVALGHDSAVENNLHSHVRRSLLGSRLTTDEIGRKLDTLPSDLSTMGLRDIPRIENGQSQTSEMRSTGLSWSFDNREEPGSLYLEAVRHRIWGTDFPCAE